MSDIQPENNEELKNSVEPNDSANEKIVEPTEEIKIESAEEKVEEINKIIELEDKIKSLQDTLLRKAADFENYKRRTENDQLNLLKYAAESFILKVLPIYDDLNRSVQHLGEDSFESVKEGLKLILDKFTKILE